VCAHDPAALPHGNLCAEASDLPLPTLEPRALAPGQIRTLKNVLDRLPHIHQHKGRPQSGAGELHGHARPLRDRAHLPGNGLRREELVNLDLDQIVPNTSEVLRAAKKAKVSGVRGKGRTTRTVFLGADGPTVSTTWNTSAQPTPTRPRPRSSVWAAGSSNGGLSRVRGRPMQERPDVDVVADAMFNGPGVDFGLSAVGEPADGETSQADRPPGESARRSAGRLV